MNSAILQQRPFESAEFARPKATLARTRHAMQLGHVYPRCANLDQRGSISGTEFMAFASAERAGLQLSLRFLHPVSRGVASVETRVGEPKSLHRVNELVIEARRFTSAHESIERELKLPAPSLRNTIPFRRSVPFRFYPWREFEPVRDSAGQIAGAIIRSQSGIEGVVKMRVEPVSSRVFNVKVELQNHSMTASGENSDALFLRTFVSSRFIVLGRGLELVPLAGAPSS